MTNVIVRKEKIGGPIRLEQRSLKTGFAKLVFVRINQVGIGMGLQKFHHLKKRIRFDDIIMIQKSDPLPVGKCESLIRCGRDSFMFPEALQNDTPIASGE